LPCGTASANCRTSAGQHQRCTIGHSTTARRLGPVVVDYSGRATLRLEQAISIGIVEATVDVLDLERALDRAPTSRPRAWSTPCRARPDPVPVDLVEAATRRVGTGLFPLVS
jgi:hypothetical protein